VRIFRWPRNPSRAGALGGGGESRSKDGRSGLSRYCFALGAVLAALIPKLLLDPALETHSPFLVFFAAVMASAWYGGLGPGLLATGCSVLLGVDVFLPPDYSLALATPHARHRVLAFVLEGVMISLLSEALHAANRRAKASQAEAGERQLLLGQSESRRRTAESLAETGRILARSLDPAVVAREIVEHVRTLLGAQSAGVYRLERESGDLVALSVSGDPVISILPRGTDVAGLAVSSGRLVVTPDLLSDPRVTLMADARALAGQTAFRAVLALPLIAQSEVIGVIAIRGRTGRMFGADEIRLAQAFGDQAAIAIHNAQLHDELQQRLRQTKTLLAVSQVVGATLDVTETLRRTTREAVRALGADLGAAWSLSPSGRELTPVAGYHVSKQHLETCAGATIALDPGDRLLEEANRLRGPICSSDSQTDPRFAYPWMRALDHKSILVLPIASRATGTLIGGLAIVWVREVHRFRPDELRLAAGIGQQAAVAMENAQLLQELKTGKARLEAILELNRQLSGIQPLDSLLDKIAEACGRLLDAPAVGFRLLEGHELVLTGTVGDFVRQSRLAVGESVSGIVAATGEPILVDDPANDARLIPAHREAFARLGYRTLLVAPVKVGDSVAGVLSIATRRTEGFSSEDVAIATAFASQAALAVDNVRLYEAANKRTHELEEACEQLRTAQGRIIQSERLHAVAQLAGGVAHDFNNLLAVILGRAQRLIRQVLDQPSLVEQLHIIEQAALDGAQTVKRLQDLTRVRSPRAHVPVAAEQLLREAREFTRHRWENEAQARGVTYDVVIEADSTPTIAGDPAELREVFTNLVLNAIEAMPQGGQVFLRATTEGKRVRITVQDTGRGMPAGVAGQIFEPFFTTKGPLGTGLGLSVVWGVVQRHQGEITVDSAEEKGTTFTLHFPLLDSPQELEPPSAVPSAVRGARILIIDDEIMVRSVLSDFLRDEGYTVVEVASGPAGLARYHQELFDLVLTDLAMPGMSGLEVAATIKRHRDVPVGLVTGWSGKIDTAQMGERQVDFVVQKPFQLDDVSRQIGYILASRDQAS
jgi:signal transduction histidine kinase